MLRTTVCQRIVKQCTIQCCIAIAVVLNLALPLTNVAGQTFINFEKNRYFSVSGNVGKVEIHSPHVQNLNGTYPMGISFDYGVHDFSKHAIETYGCNIRYGAVAQLWQFNNEVLGHGFSTMAYAEPFLLAYDRFMLSIKASAGLIALTNPYDPQNNPDNQAYSTHVAFPLAIGAVVYVPITYKWAVICSGSFNHFSNGGIKKPNYGLNYTTVSIGLEHSFNNYGVPPRKSSQNMKLPHNTLRHRLETNVAVGMNEDDAANKTTVALINTKYYYRLTRINGIGAGVLAEADIQGFDDYSASALVSHRFYLGKFGFSQDLGLYLINTNEHTPDINQFYTIDFPVVQQLLLGITLKAHGNTAQYLGFKLGWHWGR